MYDLDPNWHWDGYRWMYVPKPQVVVVQDDGAPNHLLHAVLTLLSCGLWLPVWLLVIFCDWIAKMTSGYNKEQRGL